MFKAGDKVARRGSPTVLFGVVVAANLPSVVRVGEEHFFASSGSMWQDGQDRQSDIVPFVEETGEKKFWIVREVPKTPVATRHQTEEAAIAEAIELAKKWGTKYGVFEATSYHEINNVVSTKFV